MDLSNQQNQGAIRKNVNRLRQLVRAPNFERTTAEIMDMRIKEGSLLKQDEGSDSILNEATLHWETE